MQRMAVRLVQLGQLGRDRPARQLPAGVNQHRRQSAYAGTGATIRSRVGKRL
jgi:hypothetical protein